MFWVDSLPVVEKVSSTPRNPLLKRKTNTCFKNCLYLTSRFTYVISRFRLCYKTSGSKPLQEESREKLWNSHTCTDEQISKVQFGVCFVWLAYVEALFTPILFQPLAQLRFDSLMSCHLTVILKVCRNGAITKATLQEEFCVFLLIIHSKTYARFLWVNVPDRHRL